MRASLLLLLVAACSVPDKEAPADAGVPDASPTPDAPSGPIVTITSTPSTNDNSDRALFGFSANDQRAHIECSLDGATFAACTSPMIYSSLGAGSHQFAARAFVDAGHDGPTTSFTWTIDFSSPDTTIDSGPTGTTNNSMATFRFSAHNAGSNATFECRFDQNPFSPCTSGVSQFPLADGGHTFEVRARTSAGVVDPTPAQAAWLVDTVAPVVTITKGPPDPNYLGKTSFEFTADDPAATFECTVDGAPLGVCNGAPWAWTWIGNGKHTVRIHAKDAAGNVGADATYSWTTTLANLVFTASVSGTDLGGLTGADAQCQQAAQFEGYQGTYRAWLSTSTVNAIDRVAGARGWINTDGHLFADTPADLAASHIVYPLDAGYGQMVLTATTPDGHYDTRLGACDDWTSNDRTLYVTTGASNAATKDWMNDGSTQCGNSGLTEVYCFGVDASIALAPTPVNGRRVFLSAATWTPGGGLASADAVCASEASAAHLSGTFIAALATSKGGSLSRLSSIGLPWVRLDGVPIAPTAAALFDPNLHALDTSINVTASGAYVTQPINWGDSMAWSGPRLAAAQGTCADWTSTSALGTFGAIGRAGESDVFGYTGASCSYAMHLLCFQQ